MPRVHVSIGSNVDRERSVRGGVADLARRFGELSLSDVYDCPAVGFKGQAFLNLVAAFDCDLTLEALNAELKEIEANNGRVRGSKKFSDRTLDIDVLLFGDLIKHEGRIDVPRYEIRRYAFVLRPLSEMIPDRIHPELKISYREMWAQFDDSAQPMTRVDFDFEAGD